MEHTASEAEFFTGTTTLDETVFEDSVAAQGCQGFLHSDPQKTSWVTADQPRLHKDVTQQTKVY